MQDIDQFNETGWNDGTIDYINEVVPNDQYLKAFCIFMVRYDVKRLKRTGKWRPHYMLFLFA